MWGLGLFSPHVKLNQISVKLRSNWAPRAEALEGPRRGCSTTMAAAAADVLRPNARVVSTAVASIQVHECRMSSPTPHCAAPCSAPDVLSTSCITEDFSRCWKRQNQRSCAFRNADMCWNSDESCTLKNGNRRVTLFLSFFNTLLAIALLALGGVYTSALQ